MEQSNKEMREITPAVFSYLSDPKITVKDANVCGKITTPRELHAALWNYLSKDKSDYCTKSINIFVLLYCLLRQL